MDEKMKESSIDRHNRLVDSGAVPLAETGLNQYKVGINQVENGFIVYVGCKSFVFSKLTNLLNALEVFYKDPSQATSIFLGKKDHLK